jgi:hypothetical protein
MEKVKLIWDFRGADAAKFAEHHVIHLKQYAEKKLGFFELGNESKSEMHAIAYIVVEKSNMILVRDDLKPHRGEMA